MPGTPQELIRILCLTESDLTVTRILHPLHAAGLSCLADRVATLSGLRQVLPELAPDVVVAEPLPGLDTRALISASREGAPQVEVIVLRETSDEARSLEAIRAGALDCIAKSDLHRLAPALRRVLERRAAQAERRNQHARIERLNRVLRMLSGINGLMLRIKEADELLRESCRLATTTGGYAVAIAALKRPGTGTIDPLAAAGVDADLTAALRAAVADSAAQKSGLLAHVLKSGEPLVLNDLIDSRVTAVFDVLLARAGFRSLAALPLSVDGTPVGALLFFAAREGAIADDELGMLRELAGNLSFALQYLQKDSEVRRLAHFDPQTGLAKCPLFCERLSRLLEAPPARHVHHAVVTFDVEQLSVINDYFGRRTGDLLLQHVADRLRRHVPQTERIAHFGGGTFALALELEPSACSNVLSTLQSRVDLLFKEPLVFENREIPISIRMGLALCPADATDAPRLIQHAEVALHKARSSGERRLRYCAADHSEMIARLTLEHRLRQALERRQFELHYQPKISIADGSIRGAEALLRWRNPEAGLSSPAQFLPILESSGLIVEVGEWILEQASADSREWMSRGLPPIRIAVNVTPMQLGQPGFADTFHRCTRSWTGDGWGLDIEITERMLQEDSAEEIARLDHLRASGTRVAIDDFGTGYSSLSRLSSLPIDTLKIDRSFITGLVPGTPGEALIQTIISLARALKLSTIAEGVETQEQLQQLRRMGCEEFQGYLYSKPVCAEDFVALLAAARNASSPARRTSHSPFSVAS